MEAENYLTFIKNVGTDLLCWLHVLLFICAVAQEMSLWACKNINKLKKKQNIFFEVMCNLVKIVLKKYRSETSFEVISIFIRIFFKQTIYQSRKNVRMLTRQLRNLLAFSFVWQSSKSKSGYSCSLARVWVGTDKSENVPSLTLSRSPTQKTSDSTAENRLYSVKRQVALTWGSSMASHRSLTSHITWVVFTEGWGTMAKPI